jgi:tetratricopeptide (TPR) repeat protein
MFKGLPGKRNHITYYLLSFFFSVVFSAPAQDILLYNSPAGSFTFKYVKNGSIKDKSTNEIIETIAEDVIKPPTRTRISLDYQLMLKTVEKAPGVVDLFAVIQKTNMKGDVHFRKFDIRDVLHPDRFDLAFRIRKRSDSTSMMEADMGHLSWSGTEKPVYITEIHGFGKNWDTLEIKDVTFYHDQDALTIFTERIHLINDYYASSFVADSLLKIADAMDLRKTGEYPILFIRLREINKILDLFNTKMFPEKLSLSENDPYGLIPKINILTRFSKSANMTFRENLGKTDMLSLDFTIDSVADYFLTDILRYIRWSLIVTSVNGRIYQEYLDNYFARPVFGKDETEVFQEMLSKLYSGLNQDSLYRTLSMILKRAYERKAEMLMQQDQYSEAVKILENEGSFCRRDPYLAGEGPDLKMKVKAMRGIYSSYLSVAEMCTENGKYQLAQKYLVKAQTYRQADSGPRLPDTLFEKVFHRIFDTWMAGCDSLVAQGAFEQAIRCYHQLEDRIDTSLTAGREDIAARIDQATISMMHDPVERVFYREDLIHQLLTGESRIWMGQYKVAAIFADSVENLFKSNGFEDDTFAISAVSKYRKRLLAEYCGDLKESFEILLLRAQNEIEKNNFLKSGVLLDSAISIAGSNTFCEIHTAPAKDTLGKYSFAIRYQKMITETKEDIRIRKFEEVFSRQALNLTFYREHDLGRFGLEIFPLYTIISGMEDPLFTAHAAVFYTTCDNLDEAFRYLVLLRSLGYPKRDSRDLQEVLGKKMAVKDVRKFPRGNPDSLLKQYVTNDDWFGRFERSYRKEWSKVVKK